MYEENNNNIEPENEPDEKKYNFFLKEPRISPVKAAFLGLAGVFILFQFGGGLLTIAIFGFDLKNIDMNAMRLLTVGGQILFILLPALLLSKLVYEDVTHVIRFYKPQLIPVFMFSIGLILLTPLLQSYIFIQNHFIEVAANSVPFVRDVKTLLDQLDQLLTETYADLMSVRNAWEASFVIFVVSVVPAICEETFFRGFVMRSFEYKLKPFWAAMITGLFFALYHFNPYGLLPLMALGVYFGFAAYTSNSIVVPIILHFLNNFIAVTAYMIFGSEDLLESNVASTDGLNEYAFAFVALSILFALLIFGIKKYYNAIQIKNGDENDLS
ncbi:MAG: CPBP family intramembrane metalloprotease [Chlorobi bacterium]|nr:CPBP family intramembrane metalloprotease [Chlorobiota bacterium]